MTAVSVPGYDIGAALGPSVYRAERIGTGREVAIKVGSRALPGAARRRFLSDARLARELSAHPHVVEVYDFGLLPDERPYVVLELCPGGSLADRVEPLPPRAVAETGQQLADVLATAHDLGLRHGDIASDKILIKPHDTVGLAGFGLAATLDEEPTVQSDVRALAATLESLLGDQAAPRELAAVLRRGRESRYPDAAALRAEFSQLIVEAVFSGSTPPVPVSTAGAQPTTQPITEPEPAEPEPEHRRPASRRRALLWAAVILAGLLVLAGVIYLLARSGGDQGGDLCSVSCEQDHVSETFAIPAVTGEILSVVDAIVAA